MTPRTVLVMGGLLAWGCTSSIVIPGRAKDVSEGKGNQDLKQAMGQGLGPLPSPRYARFAGDDKLRLMRVFPHAAVGQVEQSRQHDQENHHAQTDLVALLK